jgi:hypothetical protein
VKRNAKISLKEFFAHPRSISARAMMLWQITTVIAVSLLGLQGRRTRI